MLWFAFILDLHFIFCSILEQLMSYMLGPNLHDGANSWTFDDVIFTHIN